MEKLSRDDLLLIEGGSVWYSIAKTILDSIYLVTGILKLVRKRNA